MSKKNKGRKSPPPLDAESLALMRLVEAKRFADVDMAARRILAKKPTHHLATKALSFALIGQARFEEALPILDHALVKWPMDPELHNNRGIVLSSLMRWDEALKNFGESLRLLPDDPEVLKNLGVAYGRMRRWQEAIPQLLKAIECHPGDYIDAIEALAMSLANCNRLEEAAVCYEELWGGEKDPKFLYELFSVGMRRCAWQSLVNCVDDLRSFSSDFTKLLGNPFVSLFMPGINSMEQKRIAFAFARSFVPESLLEKPVPVFSEPVTAERRLRIGYVSADYRVHPVGFVLPQVIELHDRERVEVFGYSVGPNDGSEIRQRLIAAFDHFLDAHLMTVHQLTDRIREDQIDVLVDLNGWTTDGRPEIFALRCAPLQVNWLGYAGTMGHRKFADYLLGDPIVTPPEHAPYYTETLALMPGCYLPVDATVSLPVPPTRVQAGLPDDAFVFCSFNNSYKFNPQVFDLWCRILKETPGSCLWLSMPPGDAPKRLHDEAEARGVAADRIVFAARVDGRLDHLARLPLADLALDPFPYNSHSTGVDILSAGVPMISLLGETFPSRVGASLLTAVGLSELIVLSLEDYYQLAISLYQDRSRLKRIHDQLVKVRKDSPLFDTKGFVAGLETVFARMWHDHQRGVRVPITVNAADIA